MRSIDAARALVVQIIEIVSPANIFLDFIVIALLEVGFVMQE